MSEGATMSTPAAALNERLLLEYGERVVVENVAAGIDQPVLAVIRIGIERNVGHDAGARESVFSACRRRAGSVHRDSWPSLPSGVLSDASIAGKSAIAGTAELQASFGHGHELVGRVRDTPGHRRNGLWARPLPSITKTG